MTDRTELKRMMEEFLEITDDAEMFVFYRQHYETIKRGQADAESSYNYLKLEKEILEYLVRDESPAYPILINNLARAPQRSCFL